MPRNNNKKQGRGGGGGKKKAGRDRSAILARRASQPVPRVGLDFDSLPSFPGPETYGQHLKRILGYEYVSTEGDDKPLTVRLDGDGVFTIEEVLSGSSCSFRVDGMMHMNFVPNYRGEATYPVTKEVMKQFQLDRERLVCNVRKYISDVPEGQLGVFENFIEGGDNVSIACGMKDNGHGPDSTSKEFSCTVELLGEEYHGQSFHLSYRDGAQGQVSFTFKGCLHTSCLMKYQKELSILLSYECLSRICDGTAELTDKVKPDKVRPRRAVIMMAKALHVIFIEKKRWSDLARLFSFVLDLAIDDNFCLNTTANWVCGLGEALEAKGFCQQAAGVYAEVSRHLYMAKHPNTSTLMQNAGLAWKRHGDFEKAELYYCLALQSISFQYDHVDYKSSVFNTLTNLFLLYFDPVKNVASIKLLSTLGHLLRAAGGDPHGKIENTGVLNEGGGSTLKAEYLGASQEQMCRVIQTVIEKSTSVEEMRTAILSCSNPQTSHVEICHQGDSNEARTCKGDARGYLEGRYTSSGFVAPCSACGDVKAEKALMMCPCKLSYYCNASCQKAHWPQHKAQCKSKRNATTKKEEG